MPQYQQQRDRSRGRLRARCRPQGDADHHPGVSRRPMECSLSCQCPLPRLLSRSTHLAHPLQSLGQRDRRQGRLGARCHPQGDADHKSQVRRRPIVFAFLSAPVDTLALSPYLSTLLLVLITVFGATTSPTRTDRCSKTPRAAVFTSASSSGRGVPRRPSTASPASPPASGSLIPLPARRYTPPGLAPSARPQILYRTGRQHHPCAHFRAARARGIQAFSTVIVDIF